MFVFMVINELPMYGHEFQIHKESSNYMFTFIVVIKARDVVELGELWDVIELVF